MYILNGKVVLYPDGTGVDKQESDDVLYVQDVQTGELFTIAPNRISELAEPTDPQAVIAEREEAIAAATNQEIEQEEGAASGTAAPTEAPEVRIPAPRFSGARVTLDLPNGSSVNGVVLQETDDGVEVQTDSPVNGRFVQVFPTDEFDGMLSSVRDEADEVIWSREGAGPVDVEEENQNDAAANGQQREMQGNGIPVDTKTGEPVYEAVAPDVAWDAIVQEAEGDEAMAMQVVTDMVADMEAKVQKAKKAKVRAGSTVRKRLEAQKKHKRQIEEAEAQLEAWRRIAAVKAERIAAAERAKIEAAQQREVTQGDETDAPGNVAADAEGGTVQTDNERGRQRNLRHTPRREKNNLSKSEELKFSEELDQNGHPFILSSDGTTVFGEITKNSGLTAAPIKLNEGFNKTDEEGNNIGYGLLHIQAGHGQQILEAGYPSVQKFVEDVCRNYKEIRIGRNRKSNQTYMLLELHDEKHKCTLYVELSHDGTYWNVNSGGIFRNKYTDKNDNVWPEPTVGSNANTDTAEVANNPTEVAKGETVDRGGNSSQPISSESKDTPQNSAVQTSGQENAETSLQSEVTRAE